MKTDINLSGWNRLTISQQVDRDLEVYKNVVNWISRNGDVMVALVALACFIGAIIILKTIMVPYELPQ